MPSRQMQRLTQATRVERSLMHKVESSESTRRSRLWLVAQPAVQSGLVSQSLSMKQSALLMKLFRQVNLLVRYLASSSIQPTQVVEQRLQSSARVKELKRLVFQSVQSFAVSMESRFQIPTLQLFVSVRMYQVQLSPLSSNSPVAVLRHLKSP